MWGQADANLIHLKPMTGNGWLVNGDKMEIEWDTEENRKAVKDRVATLTRGCTCKTGCHTARCSCKKKDEECHEGCQCINCENLTYLKEFCNEIDSLEHEEVHGIEENDDHNYLCATELLLDDLDDENDI